MLLREGFDCKFWVRFQWPMGQHTHTLMLHPSAFVAEQLSCRGWLWALVHAEGHSRLGKVLGSGFKDSGFVDAEGTSSFGKVLESGFQDAGFVDGGHSRVWEGAGFWIPAFPLLPCPKLCWVIWCAWGQSSVCSELRALGHSPSALGKPGQKSTLPGPGAHEHRTCAELNMTFL